MYAILTEAELTAYEMGREAYKAGKERTRNPFTKDKPCECQALAEQWDKGYCLYLPDDSDWTMVS